MAFLQDGTTALVTATDGRIWRLNLANHSGEPLVDPPRMAYGIHDAPGDPNHLSLLRIGIVFGRSAAGTRRALQILAGHPAR